MKGPKCRLCGHEHFSNEPHRFAKESDEAVELPTPVKLSNAVVSEVSDKPSVQEGGQVEANRRWREKNPERYREYMKGYMKRKRLEKHRGS